MKDDQTIFYSIKAGDTKALKALFGLYFKSLLHYCIQIVNNTSDAEEIVQDVFVKIWQKRESINIEHSVKSYLYTSVRNAAINHIKSKFNKIKTEPLEENPIETELEDDVFSQLSFNQLNQILETAINQLPEKCRMIYLLSRNAGMSHKQIVEELGIAEKTIENQITIALKRIAVFLKNAGY